MLRETSAEICLLLREATCRRFRRRGEEESSYRSSSICLLSVHIFQQCGQPKGAGGKSRGGGRSIVVARMVRVASIHVTPVTCGEQTYVREHTRVRQRLIHESRLLSYFHRRRKFNALSTRHSRRYTFRIATAQASDRSIFANTARSTRTYTREPTSFAPRGNVREPARSQCPYRWDRYGGRWRVFTVGKKELIKRNAYFREACSLRFTP